MTSPVNEIPPVGELHRMLRYDPETGLLYHRGRDDRNAQWNGRYAGKQAGSANGRGYIDIYYNPKRLAAHRVIWVMHNGPIPDGMMMDHVNGVRSDNRLQNLRLATNRENQWNIIAGGRTSKKGNGLPKGVYWNKSKRK